MSLLSTAAKAAVASPSTAASSGRQQNRWAARGSSSSCSGRPRTGCPSPVAHAPVAQAPVAQAPFAAAPVALAAPPAAEDPRIDDGTDRFTRRRRGDRHRVRGHLLTHLRLIGITPARGTHKHRQRAYLVGICWRGRTRRGTLTQPL